MAFDEDQSPLRCRPYWCLEDGIERATGAGAWAAGRFGEGLRRALASRRICDVAVGMANSIGIRVPFLAPGCVKRMNRMPLKEFAAAAGQTKVALCARMRRRLAQRILSKAKDGWPSDMAVWLRQPHMQAGARELPGDAGDFCQSQLDGKLANGIVENHFSARLRRHKPIWQLSCVDAIRPVSARPAQSRQSVAAP